jgi:hypothetical protein
MLNFCFILLVPWSFWDFLVKHLVTQYSGVFCNATAPTRVYFTAIMNNHQANAKKVASGGNFFEKSFLSSFYFSTTVTLYI